MDRQVVEEPLGVSIFHGYDSPIGNVGGCVNWFAANIFGEGESSQGINEQLEEGVSAQNSKDPSCNFG